MNKKGFTLLEVLLASAIFSILIIIAFMIMKICSDTWFTGGDRAQLRKEITRAFMAMERELTETAPAQVSLASGASGDTITFKIPHDNDNDGSIITSAGAIEWSGDIVYALNGSNQIMRTYSGITTVLARNISSLQFTRPEASPKLIQVDITGRIVSVAGKKVIQDSGQSIIKMRN